MNFDSLNAHSEIQIINGPLTYWSFSLLHTLQGQVVGF